MAARTLHGLVLGGLLAGVFLSSPAAVNPAEDEQYQRLVNRLDSQKVSVNFQNATLQEVAEFFQAVGGVNILIDRRTYDKYQEADLTVTLRLDGVPLRTAMTLAFDMRGLTPVYRQGMLVVMPVEVFEEQDVVLRIYDVRDLLFKIRDFPGPEISLTGSSEEGGGASVDFGREEETSAVSDPDFIVELIKEHTGGESWDKNSKTSASIRNGLLFVNQSRKVHEEIRYMIQALRAYR